MPGPFETLVPAPGVDLAVITAEQDLRHRPPIEFRGAGVLRFFEQPVAKTLEAGRVRVTDRSRHQSGNPFNDRQSSYLTTSQNEVPQRDFLVDQMLSNPFIDSLEPPTNEREMWGRYPSIEVSLGEGRPSRSEEHPMSVRQWSKRGGKGFDHHDHPCPSSERCIINLAMWSDAVLPQVDRVDVDQSGCHRPTNDADAHWRVEELREQGDDRDLHPHQRIDTPAPDRCCIVLTWPRD